MPMFENIKKKYWKKKKKTHPQFEYIDKFEIKWKKVH